MSLTESPARPFLYGVATLACLCGVMYRASRGHRRGLRQQQTIYATLPILPLGVLCACLLPAVTGLVVFAGACLLWAVRVPLQGMLPVNGKAVLITGCDSGFGFAFAKHLDELGFRVFAGVLDRNGAGPLELSRLCSSRLSLLQLDVTSTEQINSAYIEVQSSLQETGLWGLINNAGVLGYIGDGELLPLSVYKRCMEVNFFGPVRVSKVFFPLLRKSKGRLVCISSMAGLCPMHGVAAYGSSKAALSMFSAVMRLELSKWGVKVASVHPSGFKTSIFGSKERWVDQDEIILQDVGADAKDAYGEEYIRSMKDCYQEMFNSSSPDLSPVLHDVDHALLAEKPNYQYTPGKSAYILPFISQYLPIWIYDGLASKLSGNKRSPKTLWTHHNQAKKYQ